MSAAKKSLNSRKKPAASSHPPFADMIKECITAHPSEARAGVSRPTIKKFLETKYGLDISAGTVTNINRAIAHGAEKGLFTLPKGPSGKVKLTPKARSDAGKENAAPASPPPKPKVAKKPKATEKNKASVKTARKAPVSASARSKKPAVTSAKRAPGTKPSGPKKAAAPAVKKTSKSVAKPVKKNAVTTSKKTTKPSSIKKPAAKRAPAKKAITGSSGSKAKTSTSKTKVPSKKAASATKRKAPTKRG